MILNTPPSTPPQRRSLGTQQEQQQGLASPTRPTFNSPAKRALASQLPVYVDALRSYVRTFPPPPMVEDDDWVTQQKRAGARTAKLADAVAANERTLRGLDRMLSKLEPGLEELSSVVDAAVADIDALVVEGQQLIVK